MIAVAMGLLWISYTGGLWGYSLIRGYDISFKDLVSPFHYYTGAWPPPIYTGTAIFPGGPPVGGPGAPTPGAPNLPKGPNPHGQVQ